jgi:uncharacterized protein
MQTNIVRTLIAGAVGDIEVQVDFPTHPNHTAQPRGLALVAHPHPLYGGTMDNKVTQTLAKTLCQLGYISVRSNFRGVGQTAGVHDNGIGEQADLRTVLQWAQTTYPQAAAAEWVMAGFSFGTFVLSHLAQQLAAEQLSVRRLVLIGTAAGKWDVAPVTADSIVIHGECDETIPLHDVLRWAAPQNLPVTVIADADHFFHRRLHILQHSITQQWHHTQ